MSLQKHIFFIQVSRSGQIEVRPDRIGFTEPFFRRIAGKMVFLGSGGDYVKGRHEVQT